MLKKTLKWLKNIKKGFENKKTSAKNVEKDSKQTLKLQNVKKTIKNSTKNNLFFRIWKSNLQREKMMPKIVQNSHNYQDFKLILIFQIVGFVVVCG